MSERRLINKDGAKAVKNSGRGIHKGDAQLPPFLVDYKEYAKGIRVDTKMWKKISEDAWEEGHLEGCLGLNLQEDNGNVYRLAVIDWHTFLEMRQAWIEKNKREYGGV